MRKERSGPDQTTLCPRDAEEARGPGGMAARDSRSNGFLRLGSALYSKRMPWRRDQPGRDLAVIDPDQFEQLAGSLSKAAHNAMMRDCGFDAMILRDKGHDPVVARMRASRAKRCAAEGCGRFAAKQSLTRAQHGDQGIPF